MCKQRPRLFPPLTCSVFVIERAPEGSGHSEARLPSTIGMRRRRDGRKCSERRRSSLFNPASVGVCVTEEVEPQSSGVAGYPEHHLDTGVSEHVRCVSERGAAAGGGGTARADSAAESAPESELSGARHSTPEPPQSRASRQAKRKAAQSATRPERGHRAERAPLKKPWEVKTQRNDHDLNVWRFYAFPMIKRCSCFLL